MTQGHYSWDKDTTKIDEKILNFKYPLNLAPRSKQEDKYKGSDNQTYTIPDPYRYMEESDSAAVINWLSAEKKVTKKFFDMCDEKEHLKQSLIDYINFPKISLPARRGENYYFTYNKGLEDQSKTYKIDTPGVYKVDPKEPLKGASLFFDPAMLSKDGKS